MQGIFKFLIKDEVIPVQPFDKLMNISKNIRNELIFSNEHSYRIESKVGKETIEEFIRYIIFDEQPEITINNINEYERLSEEFSVLQEIINNKKNEYGEYLVNFKGISSEDEIMRNIYEERISTELDEYLTRYGEEMMKISIQSLYNIFNHSKRNLNNHNLAYESIISYFNKTQDSNIFILLDLLDGTKLTRNNIEESYSLSTKRNNHMPKIDFSTISDLFSTQRKQSELLEEQRLKYSELLERMNEQQLKQEQLIEEQRKLITRMNNQQKQQEFKYKQIIETLENKIKQLISTQKKANNNIEKKYSTISEKLDKHIKNNEQDNKNLNKQIQEQNSKIAKFEEEIEKSKSEAKSTQNNCQPFIAKLDKSSPGILQRLKNNEKSPFDHLFIPSQSSNDIYSILDPSTNDNYCITDIGEFIEIELEESITIIGIKLFSSTGNFPKSFDIEIDNKKISSIKEAKELNGENQEMTININSIRCNKIRIINKGQNWNDRDNFCNFKQIELLSNESKYSRGIFSTLIYQSENHDPHKCPVFISASRFDFNTFHSIDSPKSVCTFDYENSWFQIEFSKGKAIINGFRLKRCDPDKLKQYKIICTDDVSKSIEEWTTLFEIDEKSKNEHEMLDIYEFPQPSPPIKFIRLIRTGPTWNNSLRLKFNHLDFFGSYI